jgi:hypothetical protein
MRKAHQQQGASVTSRRTASSVTPKKAVRVLAERGG